jgi:Ni/Co efflux regulator RcnB
MIRLAATLVACAIALAPMTGCQSDADRRRQEQQEQQERDRDQTLLMKKMLMAQAERELSDAGPAAPPPAADAGR